MSKSKADELFKKMGYLKFELAGTTLYSQDNVKRIVLDQYGVTASSDNEVVLLTPEEIEACHEYYSV